MNHMELNQNLKIYDEIVNLIDTLVMKMLF